MSVRIRGEGPNPSGLCMCGCGAKTKIAAQSVRVRGDVFGTPLRFVTGHANRTHGPKTLPPNPGGMCFCGCGQKTPIAGRSYTSDGIAAGEHVRFVRGHQAFLISARASSTPYLVDPDTGCWIWNFCINNTTGYGQLGVRGRLRLAHRYMYEQRYGLLARGLHLHHTCENKRCVNPDHLTPLTPSEHMRAHAAIRGRETRIA